MATATSNYAFNLPAEGSDDDLWGGYINANWAALDALLLSMQQQIDNQRIKVGDLYLSTDAANPTTKLGYGTWEEYASGRALIGVGNNGAATWAIEEERGTETHVLVEAEMPAHSHVADPPNTALSMNWVGNHQHYMTGGGTQQAALVAPTLRVNGDTGGSFNYDFRSTYDAASAYLTSEAGGFTPSGTVDIAPFNTWSKGSGAQHNNVQPSIAIYIWKRLT